MPRPWRRPGKGDGRPAASRRRGRSRWLPGRTPPGLLEVEPLRPVPFLALVEAGQQILEIGLSEAAQREVPGRRRAQVDQQAGQQVRVPLPADLVQRDVEQAGVLRSQVEQDHGHRREAGTAGGDEPLVAGDDAPVGAPREHGVDDPERGDRAGQGRQLVLPDAARVARIRMQGIDRQLFHLQGGGGGRHSVCTASAPLAVMGTPPSGAGSRGRAAGGGRADRPIGPRSGSPRPPAA